MLRLKCGEPVGVFFQQQQLLGKAKEVVGRRQWKQPFSPENLEDSGCSVLLLGCQGRRQTRAANRLCCHPQLPLPMVGRCCRIRLLHQTLCMKSLRPLCWGYPHPSFLHSPAPLSLKCHWGTPGSNFSHAHSKSEVGI